MRYQLQIVVQKGRVKVKSDHKYNRDETVVNDNKLSRAAESLRSKIVPVNLDHSVCTKYARTSRNYGHRMVNCIECFCSANLRRRGM